MARTNNIEKLKDIGLSEESFSAGEATRIFNAVMQKLPKKQNAISIVNSLGLAGFKYLIKSFLKHYKFANDDVSELRVFLESELEGMKNKEAESIEKNIESLKRKLKKLK